MALVQSNINEFYAASNHIGPLAPVTATLTVTHDWGDVVIDHNDAAYVDPNLEYNIYFESSGVHKLTWNWTDSFDGEYTEVQYVEVVQRYVTSSEFFIKHPELEAEFAQNFNDIEAVARKIIDTFCGQNFQFVSNGTLTYEGSGGKNLFLGRRLDTFSEVLIGEDDVSSVVGPFSDDDFDRFLQFVSVDNVERVRFTDGAVVTVTGNWGYPYVPSSISTAAEILILEIMNDDRVNYTHGIDQIWMDTQRTEFKDGLFDTTGNLDVDTLIMDYMILGWDYV